jgi:hypothetical protein
MSSTFTRSAAALLAASALAGGLLGAAPASAHKSYAKASCTVTAAERAADRDQLRTLSEQLKGNKLTRDERRAFEAAVAELVRAARDAKMPAAERQAKYAELKTLVGKLKAATTAEERTAIRVEIDAVKLQLDAAKLTKAERAALSEQIREMYRTLRNTPTQADKAAIKAQIKELGQQLRCKVVG